MERFLSYDRFMSYHRNRNDVEEIPEDKLTIAYHDTKFNQYYLHLLRGNQDMVKKVTKEIHNDLQDPKEVFKYSLQHPELLALILVNLRHEDSKIRELSSDCFVQFCLLLNTKEHLDNEDYIKFCAFILDDTNPVVRFNGVKGLINYSQSRYGIDVLVKNSVLKVVIKKLSEESDEKVQFMLFSLLNEILNSEGAPQIALENKAISVIKKYLDSKNDDILEKAIVNLGSISLCEEGKKECIQDFLIFKILENLEKTKNNRIIIASTRFLKSVTILKLAKEQVFEKNGIELCIKILETNIDEQVILNILQLIGNVAEEPRGKKKMLENIKIIEKYLNHEFELISEQALITKDIIEWKSYVIKPELLAIIKNKY